MSCIFCLFCCSFYNFFFINFIYHHTFCSICDPNGTNRCEDLGDGIHYNCVCNDKYSGIYCSTFQDACQSVPCRNGAQCNIESNSGGMSFNCMCATGWTGIICDVAINECASNPCSYSGYKSVGPARRNLVIFKKSISQTKINF